MASTCAALWLVDGSTQQCTRAFVCRGRFKWRCNNTHRDLSRLEALPPWQIDRRHEFDAENKGRRKEALGTSKVSSRPNGSFGTVKPIFQACIIITIQIGKASCRERVCQ